MGLLVPDWPNGVLGMVLAGLATLLLWLRVRRRSPWDIHDENSYREYHGFSVQAVGPPLVLFGTLLTLMLGLGAIDRNVRVEFAILGDALGLGLFLFTVLRLARQPN